MIVELYPLDNYSDRVRVMVHVSPNEWQHLYCIHGLDFPGFRLMQHESTRFVAVARGRGKLDPMHVYETLRREFAKHEIKHEKHYAERRQRRLPRGVKLHANLKRERD